MDDPGGRRFQWGLGAASLAIVLFAAFQYVQQLTTQGYVPPLEPLAVDPRLAPVPTVPLSPGALSGRSLVLITLDTARPDRLGLYGNASIATPHLDRLAQGGVVFTNARATAALTLPTHASILTGKYPHSHGARVNGRGRLAPDQVTLAEALRAHGYETAAFVSAFVLDARFGLAQGFDVYDDVTDRTPGHRFGYPERRAEDTTDAALAWLRNDRRGPFFLWVHYYDPHLAYTPPPQFEAASDNRYDGEIAYVDAQIGRLLAATGDALVAVAADHGESFGAQGEGTHGFLVQEETLRIPLILGTRGGLPRPARVDALVSQVDLVPTLLSLLGIAIPEGVEGADLTRPVPERPVLAEAHYGQARYGWARLAAIYRGQLKYVDGPIPELYDLVADPRALRNLAATRPGDVDSLRRELLELRGAGADTLPPVPARWIDGEVIDRLEALGYGVAGTAEASSQPTAANPREQMPDLERVKFLVAAPRHARGLPAWYLALLRAFGKEIPIDTAETIAALESFATAHPDFAPVYEHIAQLYDDVGDSEAAQKTRERFAELVSDR